MKVLRVLFNCFVSSLAGGVRHWRKVYFRFLNMVLAGAVFTSYTLAIEPSEELEYSYSFPWHTLMSYHNEPPVKSNQSISFDLIADRVFGEGPLTLRATASSGLLVSYSVVSGPALLEENMLLFTGPGKVSVRASQPGDESYNSAPSVLRSFEVISTWDNWLMTHFLEAEREQPSVAGDAADADDDGMVNVVEYALGLDPRVPSPLLGDAGGLDVSRSDGLFVCRFSRNPNALDVSIIIEESIDLSVWNPVANSIHGSAFQTSREGYTVTESSSDGVIVVELSSPFPSSGGYFQRVLAAR